MQYDPVQRFRNICSAHLSMASFTLSLYLYLYLYLSLSRPRLGSVPQLILSILHRSL